MSCHAKYNQSTSLSMLEPPTRKSYPLAKFVFKLNLSQARSHCYPQLEGTFEECRNKKLLGNNPKRPITKKLIFIPSLTLRRRSADRMTGWKLTFSVVKLGRLIVSLSKFYRSSWTSWTRMSYSIYWQRSHWRARHRRKQYDWWWSLTQPEINRSHWPSRRKSTVLII